MIWWYVGGGIAAAILLIGLTFLFLIKPRSKSDRPDTTPFVGVEYAHRGVHTATIPENSLRAFQGAMDRGLGIELDIQLSADDQVMVVHDLDLKRVAGLDKKVRELTADELSRVSLCGQSDGIPTLRQVLSVVDGKVPLIIELKIPGMDLAVCEKAFEILDEYRGPYCIESFHPLAIARVRKLRPHVLRGQLSSDFFKSKDAPNNAVQLFAVKNLLLNVLARPDFIAFDIRYPKATAFRLCCKLWGGVPIGWTIRTKDELEAAKKTFDAWICENIYETE